MMASTSISVRDVPYKNLLDYLLFVGWEEEPTVGRWLVFGSPDGSGEDRLEIVLPRDPLAHDVLFHIANAVDVLSATSDDMPNNVARRIRLYDRDVLMIRNSETGDVYSMELDFAADQITEVRNLIGFSACSVHDPQPHFDSMLSIGRNTVRRYRFGHTFQGSFGFTVESPSLEKPGYSIAVQDSFLPGEEMVISVAPFDRRVMERVVRGLMIAREATEERDAKPLVEGYQTGFNSRMCRAIVNMSKEKVLPLEYSVLWSPKIKPGEDIDDTGVIRLTSASYHLLEEAAAILGEIEPEWVIVRGRITDLHASDDPLELGTPRTVRVLWIDRPGGEQPVAIRVTLGKDEYVQAINAHRNWNTIEVKGRAERKGNIWYLRDAYDFRIIR